MKNQLGDNVIRKTHEELSVSVILVTHNRTERLKQCIQSILANTVLPKEIIVIDNSDVGKDSKELIRSFKKGCLGVDFIFKRERLNRGLCFAKNLGIKISQGSIIAFIDDDADAAKDWIEQIIQSHSTHKDAVAITGLIEPSYPENYWNRVVFQIYRHDVQKLKKTTFLFGANMSFKKGVITNYNLFFNEQLPYYNDDRDISLKFQKLGLLQMYDPKTKIAHDYRTNTLAVVEHWFRYGLSDYSFWHLTPDYHSRDSDYFRVGNPIKKLLKAPYRIPASVYTTVTHLNTRKEEALIPGLILIFSAYYTGIYFGFLSVFIEDILSRVRKHKLKKML